MKNSMTVAATWSLLVPACGGVAETESARDSYASHRQAISPCLDTTPADANKAPVGEANGGGGSPPPPPPPAPDVSSSYLDDSARQFLRIAGVSNSQSVGGTLWVDACRVRATQGAVTFDSGVTKNCTWANLQPGWIVLETNYVVLENRNGRGGAAVSSTNGPVSISTTEFGSKFDAAISSAGSSGDKPSEAKLKLEYQRLNGYSYTFSGQGNQVVAEVTANGGLFEASAIEIQARAKLLRIH